MTTETEETVLPDAQPVLRVVPMPADLNGNGDVFGGWVMSQVDIAGGVLAHSIARGPTVTVSVNSFYFRQPIAVSDVVSFYATLVKIGRTSITVDVQVYATRMRLGQCPETVKVTEATLTYVAIHPGGGKREVPADALPHSPFDGPC